MASLSPFVSDDQFLCSICLEVFTEPVSTPCGHNFCKACITRHWDGKEQPKCPLCNESFNKELKLGINTGFREIVECFRTQCEESENICPVQPGQVPCDCCLGNTSKASKTCLVCLTSFCETHLEPHHRVAALKRHTLTNPVHNLEDKICKKHNRMLDLFCMNDLTHVCVLCTEHSAHETVPLEKGNVEQARLGKGKMRAQEIKPKFGKNSKKKVKGHTKRKNTDETLADSYIQVPYIYFPNEGPHQINRYLYLPNNVGISKGKFYYEVESKEGTCWFLGMVRESNLRKQRFTLKTSNGNWTINLENNRKCTALENVPVSFLLTRKPKKVTVFVDYDNGLLSFYDGTTPIYTFTGCRFRERIFLFDCSIQNASMQEKLKKLILYFILTVSILMMISSNPRGTD